MPPIAAEKIAIIGSGISGLGTAFLLDPHHDVTLFEAQSRLGGHTRTVEVEGVAVDTGFIVLNRRTYPLFAPLLDHLGVELERSDMSFSASFDGGRYEYGTFSARAMFAQPGRLFDRSHLRLIQDVLRFFRQVPRDLDDTMTIGELIAKMGLGAEFRERFLLPISGAIWSTPTAGMMDFPAATFVRFFENHGLLSLNSQPEWLTVTGGAKTYIDKICARLRGKVRLDAEVLAVRRHEGGVDVITAHGAETFDRVILATHAPQALAVLDCPDAQETAILGAFRTEANRMVLHSDPALMPRRRSVWASWNYVTKGPTPPTDRLISLSYWMNRLQNLSTARPMIVTLNPEIEPSHIHDETVLHHPQFDERALRAQARLATIQGRGGVYYAGAWTRYGFHEDGLLSALRVAQLLGVDWPLGPDPWSNRQKGMA